MRHIPEAIIWISGFVAAFWVSLYFSPNKTIGIWSLFGAIVFAVLTGFLYWQNDIWKSQPQTNVSPAAKTYKENDKLPEAHETPPQKKIIKQSTTNFEAIQQPIEPSNKLEVGEDSVVMGNVPPNTKVGNGSVVIGPTDNRGNTIINTPMAVGRGAKAGPGSIAIGAGAGAGLPQEKAPEK